MAKIFPPVASNGAIHYINENRKVFVYRGGKWDLTPIIDRFKGDDAPGPIITEAIPVEVEGQVVPGAGRLIENTFSITDLDDLETI